MRLPALSPPDVSITMTPAASSPYGGHTTRHRSNSITMFLIGKFAIALFVLSIVFLWLSVDVRLTFGLTILPPTHPPVPTPSTADGTHESTARMGIDERDAYGRSYHRASPANVTADEEEAEDEEEFDPTMLNSAEPHPTLVLLHGIYRSFHPLPIVDSMSLLPPPSPGLIHWLTRTLVVGIMGFERQRIESISATWARYVRTDNLFFFTDTIYSDHPRVINLPHPRPDADTTDRRASAWKILPAIRYMYQHAAADVKWFYLADDDSYPLIHMLATLTSEFDSTDMIYAGESTLQKTYMRAYYRDEEESGKVGRHIHLRYHCTGGGVLMSRRLLETLLPFLDSCPIFFASDVNLGYCIRQVANITSLNAIHSLHHTYARTPEEIRRKDGHVEGILTQAASYHHMKPPFIYDDGVPRTDSSVKYMFDTEARMYGTWLHQLAILRLHAERDRAYHHAQTSAGEIQVGSKLIGSVPDTLAPSRTVPIGPDGNVPLLRVAFVHALPEGEFTLPSKWSIKRKILTLLRLADEEESFPFSSASVAPHLRRIPALPFGGGFFGVHAFQTDYIEWRTAEGCQVCQREEAHQEEKESCQQRARVKIHELFHRYEFTSAKHGVDDKSRIYQPSEVSWSSYDLVVSSDPVFSSSRMMESYLNTTVFMHAVSQECEEEWKDSELDTTKTNIQQEDGRVRSIRLRDDIQRGERHQHHRFDGSIDFPTGSPGSFNFYGLFDLLDSSVDTPPMDLSAVFHDRQSGGMVGPDLAIDCELTSLQVYKEKFIQALQSNQSNVDEDHTQVHIESFESLRSRSQRLELFRTSRICLFTYGLKEWTDTQSKSSHGEHRYSRLLDEILWSISAGCHTFFSKHITDLMPQLKSLVTKELTSLDDFLEWYHTSLKGNGEAFHPRESVIAAGRQRVTFNRLMMEQPFDRLIKAASKQLMRQRRGST